jgi:hypothetical protein
VGGAPVLFIGNLNPQTTEHDLVDRFSILGRVVMCKVPCHPQTRVPKQVAYVQFDNQQSTEEALRRMNGTELRGRYIRVSVARAWEDRPGACDDRSGGRHRPPPGYLRRGRDRPGRFPPPDDPFFYDVPPFLREPRPYFREDPYFARPFRARARGFDLIDPAPVSADLVRLLLAQAVDRRPEPIRIEEAIRQELERREAAESMKNSDERILELFRQLRE